MDNFLFPEQEQKQNNPIFFLSNYQYKYNGKEWQDELGLNMYAMDMRMYDPAIARWVVIDPIVHHNQSPYSSFDGNPVFWADPSGAAVTETDEGWTFTGDDAKKLFSWLKQNLNDEDENETEYRTEDGRTLAVTDDGSHDVVTVPDNMLEKFYENITWTSQDQMDSEGWNAYWKTEILGFETIEELEDYLYYASNRWTRNYLIKNLQDNNSLSSWLAYCTSEVIFSWINPLNHTPTPKLKARPNSKPTRAKVGAGMNYANAAHNPWIKFNRATGVGKFTKENYGSTEAALNARLKEYDRWKKTNGYGN